MESEGWQGDARAEALETVCRVDRQMHRLASTMRRTGWGWIIGGHKAWRETIRNNDRRSLYRDHTATEWTTFALSCQHLANDLAELAIRASIYAAKAEDSEETRQES